MRKQAKKGFTIVELVIVIALIAILAAVLIPTFSNVINNAHESNDTVMVKNLNTILNAEELNGNRAQTMQEAIDQAKEGGYNVDKLTPTSTGDIVWDQESNRFVLINAKGQVVFKDESVTGEIDLTSGAYKLWKITKNVADEKIAYSLYLDKNYTGSDLADLQVKAGLDVGEHTDVAKITYTGETAAKNVTFVTSGVTDLDINAEQDTVYHYGEAGAIKVIKCAMESYHENGKVNTLTVEKGHVELAATAKVNALVVESANKDNVKLSANEGAAIVNAILPAGVDGAAEVEAKAENKVDSSSEYLNVTTVEKLNEALAQAGDVYVRLGADIDAGTTSIVVAANGGNANITIEGNGHTITSTNNRMIQTCKDSGPFTGVLTVTNVVLVNNCTSTPNNTRGLSLWNFCGVLNVSGCKITMPTGVDNYGINLAGTDDKSVMNIKNTEISAYQCINIYGTKNTVNVENCVLNAVNEHNTYTGAGITVFENAIASVTVKNSSFTTRSAEGKAPEYGVAFGSALGKTVYADMTIENCKLNGEKFAADNTSAFGYVKNNLTNGTITLDGVLLNAE